MLGAACTDSWHGKAHHLVYNLVLPCDSEIAQMRTTMNIDDELLREARRLTGVTEKAALVREGLRALIERESARRLARLGGSEPQLEDVPRRRSESA